MFEQLQKSYAMSDIDHEDPYNQSVVYLRNHYQGKAHRCARSAEQIKTLK